MFIKRDVDHYMFDYPIDMDGLLNICVDKQGSDLHLVAGAPPCIRVMGDLVRLDFPPLSASDMQILVYSILEPYQIESFEQDLELDFSYSIPNLSLFRGNLMVQRSSLAACFRPIPFQIPRLEDLNLPPIVSKLCDYQRGLILVTGTTGSGKSTTLASIIDRINTTQSKNIVTLEDPIEFMHRHKKSIVKQREVGSDTQSFSKALTHVLRHDPNIIFVGEMRDLDSISIALTAAETGHLVLSTMHTQTAYLTINRIVDVFEGEHRNQVRKQLANSLRAVICQQLIPKKNGDGRVVAVEAMIDTPTIRNMIRDEKEHQIYSSIQTGQMHGMQTMDQSLAKLFHKGLISEQMAVSNSIDKNEIKRLLSRKY